MATLPQTSVERKAELHRSILSGTRWTLWLSVLSVPFSYGTSLLLARIGPRVLGTFGVLTIYIAAIAVFVYFGGNAVLLRFVPTIPVQRRWPFLRTFGLILLCGVLPWLALAAIAPRLVSQVLFGQNLTTKFLLFVIGLSPVCLAFQVGTAALKALMEIKWAQVLDRAVPIGSCMVYGTLFVFASGVFLDDYRGAIWGVYFGIVCAGAIVAWVKLFRRTYGVRERGLGFYLPPGFWPFTASLQLSSVLGFLATRMDLVFVLHFGGLKWLGKYFAVISVASVVTKVAAFFLDPMFPSLTNTLAQGDNSGARDLAKTYLRLVMPCVTALSTFMLIFGLDLLRIMGSPYSRLAPVVKIAAMVAAVQALNLYTGTIFSATGRPHYETAMKMVRVAIFFVLFVPFWRSHALTGAVMVWAICESLYHAMSLALLNYKSPFRVWPGRCYPALALILGCTGFVTLHWPLMPLWFSSSLWIVTVAAFLAGAGYTLRELRGLMHYAVPMRPPVTNPVEPL